MSFKLFVILCILSSHAFTRACKKRLEKAIEDTAAHDSVLYFKTGGQLKRYYEAVKEHELHVKRPIVQDGESVKERLAKMYKNSTPADIDYQLENKLLEADYKGGEGAIFLHPTNQGLALKVWTDSRADQFELSTKALMVFEDKVLHNNRLKNYLSVTKIKEIGRNYIVRDFAPHSKELKEVANKPAIKKVIKALKRELSKSPDIINQKIMNALNKKPISANLHWDPEQRKVLLIDALGF